MHAQQIATEYKGVVWQLQHALKQDRLAKTRSQRNIFGDVIGGVTGLVTSEQFTAEKETVKKNTDRVEQVLRHEISMDKMILNVSESIKIVGGKVDVVARLYHSAEIDRTYRSKKVRFVKRHQFFNKSLII